MFKILTALKQSSGAISFHVAYVNALDVERFYSRLYKT
ncbi:hypothetical protein FJSC11DRAFT_2224 [Fischerella thermalis JSC-11]|uniref:Uncharacterized protein n=1 Tax=Fischerella thermalis JSC-11 TaxID=741277 RepID=G6FTM7_9CYAN|nr:hypothetical protein FJSC11DRAFT_2224 [Fischerella thermalis JSC-11]